MQSIMKYNSKTGEFVCYAPQGEEVLRMMEPSFQKAHTISEAVQEAYRKGKILGRIAMQREIEWHMDKLNR